MKRKPLPSTLLRDDEVIQKIRKAGGQLSRSEHDRLDQLGYRLPIHTLPGGQTGLRQQDRRRVW